MSLYRYFSDLRRRYAEYIPKYSEESLVVYERPRYARNEPLGRGVLIHRFNAVFDVAYDSARFFIEYHLAAVELRFNGTVLRDDVSARSYAFVRLRSRYLDALLRYLSAALFIYIIEIDVNIVLCLNLREFFYAVFFRLARRDIYAEVSAVCNLSPLEYLVLDEDISARDKGIGIREDEFIAVRLFRSYGSIRDFHI